MNWLKSACISILLLLSVGCNRLPNEGLGSANSIAGFYLLNQGNMGSNKCTLDYYDYATGLYTKNIYAMRNPDFGPELGDVGNDMAIYGDHLWVVVNGSNLVEVIDLRTGRHVRQIPIPNCRSIVFKDQYAYVSSYAGPMELDPNYRLGYVARIDASSFEVVATCTVGYQPEEMAIVGDFLYVANSGIYRVPDYDHSVSVVNLHLFQEVQKIDVAPNLHRMKADAYGNIWVSSRGDYYDIPSMTFVISTENNAVVDALDNLPCSDMVLCGDSLYVYSNTLNYFTRDSDVNYAIVDVKTHQVVSSDFITDGTDQQIQNPNGIAVNPQTHEIFVTDARDEFTPGKVYCFSSQGEFKWSANTGDIPSRIVFTYTPLQ